MANFLKIREMRKKRADLIKKAQEIRASVEGEAALTAEQVSEMTAHLDEADTLWQTIEADEHLADTEAADADVIDDAVDDAARHGRSGTGHVVAEAVTSELRAAHYIRETIPADQRHGMLPLTLTADQRQRLDGAGVGRSEHARLIEAAQTVGTDTAGGYTVPELWSDRILEGAAREIGMLAVGVTSITLDRFGKFSVVDDADQAGAEGEWVAESGASTEGDVTFGETALVPHMASSKVVKVTYQLLRQSNYDIATYLTRVLSRRIGLIINKGMTTGDGSAKPFGVITRATSALTTASATAIKWQEMIDLYASIRTEWAMNGAWMFNRATLGKVMQMVDSSGTPVLSAGIALRAPDMLLGRPIVLNDHMANIAATNKAVVFGDFMNYWLVREMSIMMEVFHELYAANFQVGFRACQQVGGDLANRTAKPIQFLTQKT